MVSTVACLALSTLYGHFRSPESSKTFETINEAFVHFVRDNFRNNIEDAQYMTPPEVVTFACELALRDAQHIAKKSAAPIVVCDPSCGVGSFLAQFYRVWLHSRMNHTGDLTLVGQDQVDRTANLAQLNMLFFCARPAVTPRRN